MENIIEKLNEVYKSIPTIPEEKIVVLGYEAYQLIDKHTTLVYHPEGRIVYKFNGIECHSTLVIPPMNFMVLTRDEFNKFKKDEEEFLKQTGITSNCTHKDRKPWE